ncbi:MAG: HD domain-containing phosphohydrolase [Thermodesulfobacteriota bacterium]
MLTEKQKVEALSRLGVELSQVQDLDILMEEVLSQARRFVNADAGSIYIREGDHLNFSYTQNDTLQNRLALGDKLIYSTFSIPINEKSIAGFAAHTKKALNIPDVYRIPSTSPYGFARSFDEKSGYLTTSMLTLPLTNNAGELLGVLQIINAKNPEGKVVAFGTEDEQIMLHFASVAALALERARMTRAIILRMIRMAEMRDPKETGAHVNRVGAFALELYEQWARKYGLPEAQVAKTRDIIRMAAMLHDVGKVAISDVILKKPGRFNPEEFEIMKQHSVLGARLFLDKQSDFDEAACLVAANHHERWDGKGYPGHVDIATGKPLPGFVKEDGTAVGKSGNEIPLLGRITAICDVFDALCSRRVYKEPWPETEVLKALEEGAGTQFDPELMEMFFSRLDVVRAIRARYKDEGHEE